MEDLLELKNNIEILTKENQIDILKLLKKHNNIKINENKNGVFINLSCLSKDIIEDLKKYLFYINEREKSLNLIEKQKKEYIDNL